MMDDSERRRLELELRYEERCIDLLEQSALPHRLRRDELKRLLSPVHAPVVEVEDEVLAEEDYPRW